MSLGRKQRIISTHAPAWGATSPAGTTVGGSNNFYSRPRVGGDLPQTLRHSKLPYFYSRPRVGGDSGHKRRPGCSGDFYSRPRVGGDQTGSYLTAVSDISTHAPAWGATRLRNDGADIGKFLLTPPRGGRPTLSAGYSCRCRISTHAPAWGATRRICVRFWRHLEFLLTPPRGGRPVCRHKTSQAINFYSRPRVGGDGRRPPPDYRPAYFYSRPRVGGDGQEQPGGGNGIFLLTPPRGGRPAWRGKGYAVQNNFYSRPRVGGDPCHFTAEMGQRYFYSRPRVGGDRQQNIGGCGHNRFLLTPPRGGRLLAAAACFAPQRNFYSRPRVGGDQPWLLRYYATEIISTHAPAWGATGFSVITNGKEYIISTHAPAWGATSPAVGAFMASLFLLTPPRGGRRVWLCNSRTHRFYFYSRPRVGGDGNFSQAPGRCVIQIAEKYTAIQISCPFVHAIFEKLCR